MPAERSLKRAVAKERQPIHRMNDNFLAVQDIIIPQEVSEYREDSCVIYDSGQADDKRLIVFSNSQLIEHARSAERFQMDGNFSKAPKCYNNGTTNHGQLYSIHAERNGISVPIFYVLMKQRTQNEYTRLFQFLITTGFNPRFIITDMEMAVINAVSAVFPDAAHTLCYYHLQESLYSWIKTNGMAPRYNDSNSSAFRKLVNKFSALAFVPV